MKILHINSYYSTSSFYKNLFEAQVRNEQDISVFVPISSNVKIKHFDFGDYTTISRNHTQYDRILFHIKHNKIYNDIQKKFNIKDYSLIHAHSLFSNGYIAMRLKKKYGIPYVVAVRNTDVNLFFKKMIHLRRLGLEILKEADRIIFLSKTYQKHVLNVYVPQKDQKQIMLKTSVIPNGIDSIWFNNIGKPKLEPKTKIRIIQVGDINRNKNVLTTVKAMQLLKKEGYTVKLDVVGRIVDQDIFKNIKDLDNVNYLGYKSKKELIEIYSENDIFVLPSIHETFGLVYAEAMSQGLPLIYTRGQGFDEHFENGTIGFSVNCLDEKEIAERILDIKANYKNLSANCIENVKQFNWEYINKLYNDIYH